MYNPREVRSFDSRDFDEPDFVCKFGAGEIDNMRWKNDGLKLYVSVSDFKSENHQLNVFDLKATQKGYNADELFTIEDYHNESIGTRILKSHFKPVRVVDLDFNLNYFCLNEKSDDIIYGTSQHKQFSIDLRDPKKTNYFKTQSIDSKNGSVGLSNNEDHEEHEEDIMVEFNQDNYLIFINGKMRKISIFDIRKPDNELVILDLQSKIRKLEINPFNTDEFVAVFRSYLIKFNLKTACYDNIFFDDKKMLDFNFQREFENEFLLSGDIKGLNNHHYAGFLKLSKLKCD